MSRQHSKLYIIKGDTVQQLQSEAGAFDEGWLQKFVFEHHHAIPIAEIEPAFGPLIPVCRELPTPAGPIDLLFINPVGLPTFVECKLWQNPQARREVVGQILDYAKEVSLWEYDDLQSAIAQAQGGTAPSLHKLVSQYAEDVDERDFVDSVARHLRLGRFLLLIIGEGIRENVEQMAGFLQAYAHLDFSLALVEFGIFRSPDSSEEEYFVQPRVVAQTVRLELGVFRIDDNRIVPVAAVGSGAVLAKRRTKISEEIFFDRLKADASTKAQLHAFFERIAELGVDVEPGENSLKLKADDVNLGIFATNGTFRNRGIASITEALGQPQTGEAYLSGLAALLTNGIVRRGTNRFVWTVRTTEGHRDRDATVAEMLAIQDRWLEPIRTTLGEIADSRDQ